MKYGMCGKFTAQPGKRDDLVAILLQVADLLESNRECIHYLISASEEADTVRVTETWTSKEAHDDSLQPDNVRSLIAQAMPLIASVSDQTELQVVGGKGL